MNKYDHPVCGVRQADRRSAVSICGKHPDLLLLVWLFFCIQTILLRQQWKALDTYSVLFYNTSFQHIVYVLHMPWWCETRPNVHEGYGEFLWYGHARWDVSHNTMAAFNQRSWQGERIYYFKKYWGNIIMNLVPTHVATVSAFGFEFMCIAVREVVQPD